MGKDKTIDLKGMVCPFTLLEAIKEIKKIEGEARIEILVTDAVACESIPNWALNEGHEIIEVKPEGNHFKIVLKKKA
jgi:TusA-related sulfurtransferase